MLPIIRVGYKELDSLIFSLFLMWWLFIFRRVPCSSQVWPCSLDGFLCFFFSYLLCVIFFFGLKSGIPIPPIWGHAPLRYNYPWKISRIIFMSLGSTCLTIIMGFSPLPPPLLHHCWSYVGYYGYLPPPPHNHGGHPPLTPP